MFQIKVVDINEVNIIQNFLAQVVLK